MSDQKQEDRPAVPPPPPRQPDENLKGYIERGNKITPRSDQQEQAPSDP